MKIIRLKPLKVYVFLLGLSIFCISYAQSTSDRWQPLLPGYLIDAKTFEALTVDEGVNKGKRWINAWVQWESGDNLTIRSLMGALCEGRTLQITESVFIYKNGKEIYEKQFIALPVLPNGQWEPVYAELCKRGKQWWKVW